MGCSSGMVGPRHEPEDPNARKIFCVKFGREITGLSEVPFDVEKLAALVLKDKKTNPSNYAMVTISEGGKKLLTDIHATGFVDTKNMPGNTLSEAEATELADLLDKFRG